MFGIASTFVGLSEGTAKYRFLALSSAIVAFSVSFAVYLLSLFARFLRTVQYIPGWFWKLLLYAMILVWFHLDLSCRKVLLVVVMQYIFYAWLFGFGYIDLRTVWVFINFGLILVWFGQ